MGLFIDAILLLIPAAAFGILWAAYTYSGEVGIERLSEKTPQHKERLASWAPRWSRLKATHAMCTVFCLLASSALMTLGTLRLWPEQQPLAIGLIAIYTLLFAVSAYILPFIIGGAFTDRLSLTFLTLSIILTSLLSPIMWIFSATERILTRIFHSESTLSHRPSTEDEVRSLIEQDRAGSLDEEEQEIIKSVFEFGETITREIMTPRIDVIGIDAEQNIGDAAQLVKEKKPLTLSCLPGQHGQHPRYCAYQRYSSRCARRKI